MSRPLIAACLLACFAVFGSLTLVADAQAQQSEEGGEEEPTSRREVRIDAGGGWGIPIDNVDLQFEGGQGALPVNVHSGPHAYAGIGFVRSIAEKFALGARVRGQATRLRGDPDDPNCGDGLTCPETEGLQWALTLEGRIIITAPDWINPYLLVGLGAVHTRVDGLTLQSDQNQSFSFSESSVLDAGGDIGLGASLPLTDDLYLDTEFRVTGALPGGKENAITVLPFSAGISLAF